MTVIMRLEFELFDDYVTVLYVNHCPTEISPTYIDEIFFYD